MKQDRSFYIGDKQSSLEAEIEGIAAAVHSKRESIGWTLGKLAEEAKVNEATIRVLESAKMLPLPSTIALIARALQVDLEG